MKKFFKKLFKKEEGQAVVITALVMVVIMGFAALAVDIGSVAVNKAELQNAADAAALAGAQDLPAANSAIATAEDYGEINGAEITTATTPYNGDSTKIEVVCSKTVEYTFARILGFNETDVSVRAVAERTAMGGGGGAFGFTLFSGSTTNTLEIKGSSCFVGGSIHANDSVHISGSSQYIMGSVEAIDKIQFSGSSSYVIGSLQAPTIKYPKAHMLGEEKFTRRRPIWRCPIFPIP